MRVKDVMSPGRTRTLTAKPTSSVEYVAKMLAKNRVGAVVVSKDGKHAEGIISERDIVRGVGQHGREYLRRRVGDIAIHPVKTCSPRTDIARVAESMAKHHMRHVPVTDNGILVGMVSATDLVDLTAQKRMLRKLT